MLYFGNLKSFIMELFPTYPGVLQIDWLSIVLIAIVVIFALSGIAKGTAKTFWNNFGGILVMVISFVVAALLCNLLAEMDFSAPLKTPIHDFIRGLGGEDGHAIMDAALTREEAELIITNNSYGLLQKMFIPEFLCPFVAAFILSCIPEVSNGASVADNLASGIVALIFAIVIFIIMSVILSLILGAIKKHVNKRHKVKKPGAVSRIFGFFIGAGVGVIMAVIVVWIFAFLGGIAFFRDFLTSVWYLEDDNVLTIGEFLYKTNYVNMFITWITSLFA